MENTDLKSTLDRIASLEMQLSEYQKIKTQQCESENKYRQLFEDSRDALLIVAPPSWKFTGANTAALQLFGVATIEEFTTLGPWDISPQFQPDGRSSAEKAQEIIAATIRDGSNFFEWTHQNIDGKLFTADVLLTRFELGGHVMIQASIRDISERKLSETMLQQERDFSNRLVETAPLIIVILNPEGKIVRFNHYMETLSNYSLKEVEGKDWFDIFLPESQRDKIKKIFMDAIDDIQTIGNKNIIITKDGSQKLIEWYDKTLKDIAGNTIGLISIGVDITDREQNEKELKLFRLLLDHSSDAIEIIEPLTMRFLDVNETECKTLGYTKEEILSMSVFDIDPQLDADSTNELYQLLQNKENVQIERTHRRKDGSFFPVEVNLALVEHDKTYMLGIARDITERKIAEQSLRESEEKFHSITVSAQDAILMMNDEGNISYWNEAAERMFGYSENEIMGWPLHEMLAPERFLEAHHKAFDHFKKTGEGAAVGKTLELVALKKDNTEFPIELSLSSVMSNGRWNAIGIIRDITERKKMEFELKQNEEMMIAQSKQAAMGDMIAMIAHQWRQPLAIMGMEINNLIMSISFDDEITTDYLLKFSEALNKQLHQLSDTIDNFRNFFMPSQSRVQITIEEVLENTLNIIGASCENNNIALTIQNTSKSSLFINKSSLIQVLLNILGNAKDMLLANEIKNAAITVTVSETDETISISVCDNAGGIPESIFDKIGQPYFTTKKDLNGTGLGVYISRIIIEKHLFGTLRWYNKDGGACFEVTLKINPD